MAEIIESKELVEQTAAAPEVLEAEKRYTFRKLSSDDMFLMLTIFGKIGVRELKKCFNGESLESLIASFKGAVSNDKALVQIGVSIGFDAVDIILGNLPKCKNEIYQLLSDATDGAITVDEISSDALLLMEMLVDFVHKEEFPAFIKVVSKLFK